MPSSKEYLDYVLELTRKLDNITYKKMMCEYILYIDGKIFGGIYDDRFLIKKTNSIKEYGFNEEIPYPSAKPMYLLDIESADEIKEIIEKQIKEL